MYDRTNFYALEEAINSISSSSTGQVKSGAKLLIGNVLKRSAKIFKGHFLIENNDEVAEKINKFSEIL